MQRNTFVLTSNSNEHRILPLLRGSRITVVQGVCVARTTDAYLSDLLGFSRLALDATTGIISLVEEVHRNVARVSGMPGTSTQAFVMDTTGLVYKSVRGITALVAGGIDSVLSQFFPPPTGGGSPPSREAVVAALNGIMGDYLVSSHNPLAISMSLRRDGKRLRLERQALESEIPKPSGKLVVLIHGLCMNDLQWTRKEHNHGASLAADMGYTPVYLHYNSGLHISTNGRAFADLMESLLPQWHAPIEDLVIIAHSMGGLVARSGYYYATIAGHRWPQLLRALVFLGTPHHGAPLARRADFLHTVLGVSSFTAPFARLSKASSAGIADLAYGNLLDADWQGFDRFENRGDVRHPVPLPEKVQSYAIAAIKAKSAGDVGGGLLGDGLVPVDSALGWHAEPRLALSFGQSRQWIAYGMNHFDLLSDLAVYEQIKRWLTVSESKQLRPAMSEFAN